MGIRLNGWQRIGVVLSALWMIVFLFWGLNDYLNGEGSFMSDHQFMTGGFLFVVLAPLILAWAFTYACIFSVRWIAKGFKK